MRLFLAFELDEATRQAAARVAGDLSERLARAGERGAVRWVAAPNLHVTLRFLGEVDEEKGARLRRALAAPVEVAPFVLELGGGGCFPPAGPPRVVWIGLSGGGDAARRVFEALERRLAPLGFPREARGYSPHVTLGRVRELRGPLARELRRWAASTPAPLANAVVRDVVLYRSHPGRDGSRYQAVHRTKLVEP